MNIIGPTLVCIVRLFLTKPSLANSLGFQARKTKLPLNVRVPIPSYFKIAKPLVLQNQVKILKHFTWKL